MNATPHLLIPPVGLYVALVFEVTGLVPVVPGGAPAAVLLRAVTFDGAPEVKGVGWVPDRPVCLWDTTSVILNRPGDLRLAGVPNDPYRRK